MRYNGSGVGIVLMVAGMLLFVGCHAATELIKPDSEPSVEEVKDLADQVRVISYLTTASIVTFMLGAIIQAWDVHSYLLRRDHDDDVGIEWSEPDAPGTYVYKRAKAHDDKLSRLMRVINIAVLLGMVAMVIALVLM